ncbi:MAG: alkaline phosphatase family protein, partial [Candidatus Marinimicrobia bacterium]|nr:alkaline phosphatase family protein [Candidatus Neomarinimicrobiota bacterium]
MIVIGLDGVPFSFLPKIKEMGIAPFLTSLHEEGEISSMSTTLPPVSSVAWASFLTGENPGIHGITGFVDRKP